MLFGKYDVNLPVICFSMLGYQQSFIFYLFQYVGISGSLLALHEVEGLALVMLCNHRVVTRKLAAHLLKEVKQIFSCVPALSSDNVSHYVVFFVVFIH
jgi:hypothetical protein